MTATKSRDRKFESGLEEASKAQMIFRHSGMSGFEASMTQLRNCCWECVLQMYCG